MKHIHKWGIAPWSGSHDPMWAARECMCGASVLFTEWAAEVRQMGYEPLDAPFWISAIAWNRAWNKKVATKVLDGMLKEVSCSTSVGS